MQRSLLYGLWVLMDGFKAPNILSFLPTLVLLLQNAAATMMEPQLLLQNKNGSAGPFAIEIHEALVKMDFIISSGVHNFQLTQSGSVFGDKLGFWVKTRSTTWFSQFLMREYDDSRWIENF